MARIATDTFEEEITSELFNDVLGDKKKVAFTTLGICVSSIPLVRRVPSAYSLTHSETCES